MFCVYSVFLLRGMREKCGEEEIGRVDVGIGEVYVEADRGVERSREEYRFA